MKFIKDLNQFKKVYEAQTSDYNTQLLEFKIIVKSSFLYTNCMIIATIIAPLKPAVFVFIIVKATKSASL